MALRSLLVAIHTMSAVVWVGGVFFMVMIMKWAVHVLEPKDRVAVMTRVFDRFFFWVWVSVILILVTGFYIIFALYGGFKGLGMHIHIMLTIGLLMTFIYAYIYFVPFQKLKKLKEAGDIPAAVKQVHSIRDIGMVQLVLGTLLIVLVQILQ